MGDINIKKNLEPRFYLWFKITRGYVFTMRAKYNFFNIAILLCVVTLMGLFSIGVIRDVVWRCAEKTNLSLNDKVWFNILFYGDQDSFTVRKDDDEVTIEWDKLYPYRAEDLEVEHNIQSDEDVSKNVIRSYLEENYSVENAKKAVARRNLKEKLLTKYIVGNMDMIEGVNVYNNMLGWSITAPDEYNGVKDIGDGHYVQFTGKKDLSDSVEAVINFYKWCNNRGFQFLYVQAPGVINHDDYPNIDGVLDFSNANADMFVNDLRKDGVEVLDLRKCLEIESHAKNRLFSSYFYKTDHHWNVDGGIWAAGEVARSLTKMLGVDFDNYFYDINNYRKDVYEKWFLGSAGKKVTLARAVPDDICLLYPTFDTSVEINIPSKKILQKGDFSIFYDMSAIFPKNYYNANPYSTYLHSDNPVVILKNNNVEQGKVLIIKDSFSNVMAPFLSLSFREVHMLDLRAYTGSVKSYIERNEPDVVVCEYYVNTYKNVEYSSHRNEFDFR